MIGPGDDLPALIVDGLDRSTFELLANDVVVITGKVVSKAEDRLIALDSIQPSARAVSLAEVTGKDPRLVELVLRESSQVIRARPGNLLVRHRRGWISAMAGIDRSNVDGGDEHALLLPVDPDGSAAAIRLRLMELTGVPLSVIISDSHGRPFRLGNTGVALGAAGICSVRSLEGQPALFGRPLTGASIVPTADLIASAAMLASGEGNEGRPVVIVRGIDVTASPRPASDLIRRESEDLFGQPDHAYGD